MLTPMMVGGQIKGVYRLPGPAILLRIMGRRRRVYRMGPGVLIVSEYRPVPVRGADAERFFLGMVEARRLGMRSGSALTAAERRERARKAARARWAKQKPRPG